MCGTQGPHKIAAALISNSSAYTSRVQAKYAEFKSSQAVESRFKDEIVSGASDDSIELTLRNYYPRAKLHSLSNWEMSEMFTSVPRGPELDRFVNILSIEMVYSDIPDAMIQQYNPPHRKAPLFSEVEGIRLATFKQIHDIENGRTALNCTI